MTMEELENQFKLLVGGYFGVLELDNYDLKVYILKDIEEYIRNFIMVNPIPHYNYKEKTLEYKDSLALKTKVQDALIVLHKIEAPMEVVLLMKAKLKKIEQEEKRQREL